MKRSAEIIAVGTELLLGNIVNSDAQMLSRQLSELGIDVYHHTVVGDNPERLKDALTIARDRADIIITTGGLGPTCDDLTKQTIAEMFGKKLILHEDIVRELEEFFRYLDPEHPMPRNNIQQAMLPEGCTVLANSCGTAPGCAFESGESVVIMLPGPPKECETMWHTGARPYLEKLEDSVILSRNIMLFGRGESSIEEQLRPMMLSMKNPTLAPYAGGGIIRLRVTAKAKSVSDAEAMLAPVVDELCRTLGSHVFGVDIDGLEYAVVDALRRRGLTMAAAESCTGGLISKKITDVAGCSDVYLGSVTAYHNSVKTGLLSVAADTLERFGAVSKETALEMARGVRRATGADIAVSTTGIAGPGGGTPEKPVGTVYIALSTPDGDFCRLINARGDRERVRAMSANHALDMTRRYLTGLNVEGSRKA